MENNLNIESLIEDKKIDSLFEEQNETSVLENLKESQDFKNSFLDTDKEENENDNSSSETLGFIGTQETTATETEAVDLEKVKEAQERQRIINEHNARIMKSPEYRAQVVFENYIRTCGRVLSGQEKRNLKRQFLRNAKKGMYDYLFDEEKAKKRAERQKEKFDKMNKPKIHTVDEIPENVQKDLLDMVDLSTNDIVDDRNS